MTKPALLLTAFFHGGAIATSALAVLTFLQMAYWGSAVWWEPNKAIMWGELILVSFLFVYTVYYVFRYGTRNYARDWHDSHNNRVGVVQ